METVENYYKALLRVGREMIALFPRVQTNEPLSRTERGLLAVVCAAETEGTRLISAQIAVRLGITRSAVSQAVDKLENLQYVRRVPSATDRKIAYIELAPEAKRVFEARTAEHMDVLERVLSRMGEDAMSEFLALADRFASAVREVRREDGREKEN